MARRRKDDSGIWAIPLGVGLFLALGMLKPSVRHVVAEPLLWLVLLTVAAIVTFVAYLRAMYRDTSESGFSANVFVPAQEVPVAAETDRPSPRASSPLWAAGAFEPEPAKPSSAAELIKQLRSIDWFQFEKIVGLTYKKLGYSVTRRGGANPDGGIDLMLEKDGERSAVQCKHWMAWVVGVKTVREFLGALTDSETEKGILITLRGYTGEAKQLADKHGIELITQMRLAEMLEATDARFDPETLEILRDTRKFCPKCERELVVRTAGKGRGAGQQFWGCSGYPKSRYTMPVKPDSGVGSARMGMNCQSKGRNGHFGSAVTSERS